MMDVHERFMKQCTTDVSYLLCTTIENSAALIQLIKNFDRIVPELSKYPDSIRCLKTLRAVLCGLYQEKVAKVNTKNICKSFTYQFYTQTNKIDVIKVQKDLYNQKLDPKVLPLVLDILVLHMVIYYDSSTILNNFKVSQDLVYGHNSKDDEIELLDIKLMVCYLDSLLLHEDKCTPSMGTGLVELALGFTVLVREWIKSEDRKQCQVLTLLLPKVIQVTKYNKMIIQEWKSIFEQKDDIADKLSVLCLTADLWFPIKSINNEKLICEAMEEPLWLLLLKGLLSSVPQQRKQALYLLKRVVDFIDGCEIQDRKMVDYDKVRPLICTENIASQIAFKKNLNNFFLILEALEEKQKHLVVPVFPLLKSLLDETIQQDNGTTAGIHIAWIRCALLRVLHHDNIAIVKWGLLNVFALDSKLYDDELLDMVLEVLNNTYVYENDTGEEPTVVQELTKFLSNAELNNNKLITNLIMKASKMTWGPVALFYVIHALSSVERSSSSWKEDQLEAVKSLAEINLTMHCRILRIGSQIELLETLTHFATESLDLVAIANTLSAFSTSEALIRGQLSWKRISTWLSKIVKENEVIGFIEKISNQMRSDENFQTNINMKSFSLMIMLFHDGHLIFNSKSCSGLKTLRDLFDCLIGAESRPYANAVLRKKSLELINHLSDFTTTNDTVLYDLISDYTDAILRFTFKNLRKISDGASIDDIDTYISVTKQLFALNNLDTPKREVLNHIERFELESRNIIEDGMYSNTLQRYFGIQILHACLKVTSTKHRNYIFIGPLYDTYKTLASLPLEETNIHSTETKNSRGKVAAKYYEFVAELFREHVTNEFVDNWIPKIDWIEEVAYFIEVGGKNIFAPLIGILSQILYKGVVGPANIDTFKSIVRFCWKSVFESNDCHLAIEEIMELIFSSPFLECKETLELTIEFTNEMMEKGDKVSGFLILLLKGLKTAKGEYLSHFYELILDCLIHGSVLRRDQKIELQARSYVLDCYQEVYPNYLSNMNVNVSAATRAHALTLLLKMFIDNPVHVVNLLPLIVVKFNKSQNKRYFGDSQIHRTKNRIMQVFLVLQPVLEENEIKLLHTLVCDSMLSESSQPSVRIMQEWLLIRIYLESITLRETLWELFDRGQEKRVGSLCSVMSVVFHVARSLSSDLQPDFINSALQHIMPCCMSQQFNVRLYAQVIAAKLYDLANEMSFSVVTEKYRELNIAVQKSLKHGNLMKNSIKLQDDFYFTVFNPIDDYSLQTLFYDLPRLSNVSSDEYILPQTFEKFGFKEFNSHPLKLLNLKNDISEAEVSAHILKSSGSAGPLSDDIDSNAEYSNDLQKKFIPWKSMMPNEDELNEVSESMASCPEGKGTDIILVASLIDKLPNLGGLSRTCEIFGIKEFVISSIKYTEEKEFQSLSVSAEKLIPLIEVKPHQLKQYLSEKKSMGYRLVGAEQTVNSTNLMDAKFEKKTLLLLGNEKGGIPANLIPLLDECIEIPQAGVVRSLNVHVTGAICLWEYFKQHHLP